MKLIKPNGKYEHSWMAALTEFESENTQGFWNVPIKPTNINEYLERTEDHSKGINLPDYWVQSTTYWLIANDEFVGHINIRHALNEHLKKDGGHIGYAIRPIARRKGYGFKILELALPFAKKIGLQKVLVTCDESNFASRKIIERNNGLLLDKLPGKNGPKLRFWLYL